MVKGNGRKALDTETYYRGVLAGDRALLSRAITLIESGNRRHQEQARELLTRLMPHTGKAFRIGITGIPGVGKSSFIEALGCRLTRAGHRLAVLAVDPSSAVSGGSILGDKTRMAQLSNDPNAFIRPSPNLGTLGGVADKTRESILLCEAAGFDLVLVETVGVGQSETLVAEMTDFFLALMLPGAGDELQGIKRGLLELIHLLVVNKADGNNLNRAKSAAADYRGALRFMPPVTPDWKPPVLTCSALTGEGLDRVWAEIQRFRDRARAEDSLRERRRRQMLSWMWSMVDRELRAALNNHPKVKQLLPQVEAQIREGQLAPGQGAQTVLQAFLEDKID